MTTPQLLLPVQVGVLDVLWRLAPWFAVGIATYWVYLLYRRTFRSSGDPSYRKFTSSQVGSASMLLSGAYLSGAVAAVIAVLTWPLVLVDPRVGFVLVGLVAYHAALEYREGDR